MSETRTTISYRGLGAILRVRAEEFEKQRRDFENFVNFIIEMIDQNIISEPFPIIIENGCAISIVRERSFAPPPTTRNLLLQFVTPDKQYVSLGDFEKARPHSLTDFTAHTDEFITALLEQCPSEVKDFVDEIVSERYPTYVLPTE